ncbi:MAG: hypothetical protein LBM70_03330 [Victivallales bacterium]|jgi:hypothetical protein|nr:hypothetical protein [Victivallales bacterium]
MTAKKKKSKAEKRLARMRRRIDLLDASAKNLCSYNQIEARSSNDDPEDWQIKETKMFLCYVELLYAKMLSDTDSVPINSLESCKKFYRIAQLAWNISTDSNSLKESLAQIKQTDSLQGPEESIAALKDWLKVMIETKWLLFAKCATYVNDIEFTELPNGMHDIAISMSLRKNGD